MTYTAPFSYTSTDIATLYIDTNKTNSLLNDFWHTKSASIKRDNLESENDMFFSEGLKEEVKRVRKDFLSNPNSFEKLTDASWQIIENMYDIVPKSSKCQKKFELLLKKLSPEVKSRLKKILQNNPFPTRSYGSDLNKVTRKGVLYCYEITGGDRILYDIIKSKRTVIIHFAGNDQDQIRYLSKFSKGSKKKISSRRN